MILQQCSELFSRSHNFTAVNTILQNLFSWSKKSIYGFINQTQNIMEATPFQLKKFILDSKNRKIVELILANKQMSRMELLDLNVFDIQQSQQFKNTQLEPLLEATTSALRCNQEKRDNSTLSIVQSGVTMITNIIQKLQKRREELSDEKPEEGPYQFSYRLKKEIYSIVDQNLVIKKRLERRKDDHSEYLKEFIKKILICQNVDNKEADTLSNQVVDHRCLLAIKLSSKISDDFYYRLEKIITKCSSYKDYISYGGKNPLMIKAKVQEGLYQTLVFGPKINQLIFKEIISNPFSNIVASTNELTNQQKQYYFTSGFYKSKLLQCYAQNLTYDQSFDAMAKRQRDKIIRFIMQKTKLDPDFVDDIINYSWEQLLSNQMLKHIKQVIYTEIKQNCPNFYKMCQIRFLSPQNGIKRLKSPKDIKFSLRNKFLEVNLKFQDWETTQSQLLSRNYGFIDRTQLNLEQKYKLRCFAINNIEDYYFQESNLIPYDRRIQKCILDTIIKQKSLSQRFSFDQLLNLAKEIRKNQKYLETDIKSYFSQVDLANISSKMKGLKELHDYYQSKGVDLRQKDYLQKKELKLKLLEKLLQDKIEISYQTIGQLVSLLQQNKIHLNFDLKSLLTNQVTNQVHYFDSSVICALGQEAQKPNQSLQKEFNKLIQEKPIKIEFQRQQPLVAEFLKEYENAVKKSVLLRVTKAKYKQNPHKLVQAIFDYDPYKQHTENDKFVSNLSTIQTDDLLQQLKIPITKDIVRSFIERYNKMRSSSRSPQRNNY